MILWRNELNNHYTPDKKYLFEIAKSYPNRRAVSSEIINLNAILNLPKGTEHFMSDLHGEHEAFTHIRRNASGVIRKKVDILFKKSLTAEERAELATLIYYPEEKLDELRELGTNMDEGWYENTLIRLVEIFRLTSAKYTRSKVRKLLEKTAGGYDFILDELLYCSFEDEAKKRYYKSIITSIINVGAAENLITSISAAIKSLVIDHLHIVGDIYDRGPRADLIMDELMKVDSIDIQWGNHDVLWLGAASGSRTCIATVLNNSITYKNLDVIEIGYGISLRPLSLFAAKVYKSSDVSGFMPKGDSHGDFVKHDDERLIAKMHKAISIIEFKLEGQTILRNPKFNMNDRLLLDKIDFENKTVLIDGISYPLRDTDFPTVDKNAPYNLTPEEEEVMRYLKNAFMRSERLQRHAKFLFEKGEIYTVFNKNLLFHGCIPLCDDGSLMPLAAADGHFGVSLMNYCDKMARRGYFEKDGTQARREGKDFLWFLWCGKDSPLSARKKITTFERLFIEDKTTWEEPKNAYYSCWGNRKVAENILAEFSLTDKNSHIINGHIPIRYKAGEEPIKAGGKLIVIDGGFCKAYRNTTGIGGYTLIYNAEGMRISVHEPFTSRENAIKNNRDIVSESVVFEYSKTKILVRDTDVGAAIKEKISTLERLLSEYESGAIKEVSR